jgi:hypothetical protein
MSGIEDLLRGELTRVTSQVQADGIRPLRAPERSRGTRCWRRPAGVIAAAAALSVAVDALVTSGLVTERSTSGSGSMPGYFVVVNDDSTAVLRIEVHDSASGSVTGVTTLRYVAIGEALQTVAAAPDDRTFYLSAYEEGGSGLDEYRLFRMSVSADGRPGPVTELPEVPAVAGFGGMTPVGMAVSPDGRFLAISFGSFPGLSRASATGGMETIDLATGKSRSWGARNDSLDWPGPPTWVGGDRMLAFPWWHISASGYNSQLRGMRVLDITAPGTDLLSSRMMPSTVAGGDVKSALVTTDGHSIIEYSCRTVPAPSVGKQGTTMEQVTDVPIGSGLASRVLLSRTSHYHLVNGGYAPCYDDGVLAFDASGQHLLVRALGFGRIDNGVLTSLPGVKYGIAGW